MTKAAIKFSGLVLLCLMMSGLCQIALAQNGAHPVEGKYDVTSTGETIGTITFKLTIKKEGDTWKAEIIDAPLPLNVTKVTVDADNKLNMTADAGGTEVVMTAQYDGGKINGNWTAGDAKGTWTAARADTAVTSAAGSPEGSYDAELTVEGQGSLPFAFDVKKDGEKLMTENKSSGDLSVTGIQVEGESVTLNMAYQGNPFTVSGKRAGSEMSGKWEAGGFSGTWKAKKK